MTAVDFSSFVDDLATASAAAILPFFRSTLHADDKSRGGLFDPVTEADRAGEAVMRNMIQATFPEHGIIGEEFGEENTDADVVWALDPIDGTKAFMTGLLGWGTLIGVSRASRPAYGMMSQPFTGERFFGDGGSATLRNGHGDRTLMTRRCGSVKEAFLSTTSPRLFEGQAMEAYERVERAARLTTFEGNCYAYCMIAMGQLDLVVESGLKLHDILALVPIIEGAGGVVTSWDGGPAIGSGAIVAAGDARVHEEALRLLTA